MAAVDQNLFYHMVKGETANTPSTRMANKATIQGQTATSDWTRPLMIRNIDGANPPTSEHSHRWYWWELLHTREHRHDTSTNAAHPQQHPLTSKHHP
jgi:hypothetical protein